MRTVSYRAPRLAVRAGEPPVLAATTLLGVALVWVVVQMDGAVETGSAVAVAVGAIACLTVIIAGPIPCLAAIAALTAAGLLPVIVQVGGVDLTLVDVFFAGLAVWCLWGTLGRAQRVFPARPSVAFGQLAAIVFLGYAGLTLWHIQASDPGELGDSLVSWLRLVQTASLAWLAASVIETKRDVQVLLVAIAAGGLVAVTIAAWEADSLLSERSGGPLGSNALGLVSGLLILIAAFGVPKGKVGYRIVLVVAGLAGLLLGKSVGSSVAVAIALAIGAALRSETGGAQRLTRGLMATGLAGLLVFSGVQLFRPEQIPGSQEFRYSSAYSRIVVGAAGLEIFERNPVIGVGWRGSNSLSVIGDRTIGIEVRRRFPKASPTFYPDVTPTSVHNTYIQILADLGLIGFGLFAALIVTLAVRARALLSRLGHAHELSPLAAVASLGVLLALVWYNDNPLYGGQPETVLPALLVGALAAMARLTSTSPASERRRYAVATGPATASPTPAVSRLHAGARAPMLRLRPLPPSGARRNPWWRH